MPEKTPETELSQEDKLQVIQKKVNVLNDEVLKLTNYKTNLQAGVARLELDQNNKLERLGELDAETEKKEKLIDDLNASIEEKNNKSGSLQRELNDAREELDTARVDTEQALNLRSEAIEETSRHKVSLDTERAELDAKIKAWEDRKNRVAEALTKI